MNTRDTLEVHLNVFGTFNPVLPERFRDSTHVFLANGSPAVQASVLDQVRQPQLVLADTMDLWIEHQRDDLLALLPRLDGLLLNDSEARLLTGEDNLVRAGQAVRRLGPKFVILKKGEHGAMLFSDDGIFVVPAYPTADVVDPTGAGDSFAGGILGYLDSDASPPPGRLRRAMAYGTVVASLTVEGFGLDRLKRTEPRARSTTGWRSIGRCCRFDEISGMVKGIDPSRGWGLTYGHRDCASAGDSTARCPFTRSVRMTDSLYEIVNGQRARNLR